MENHVKLGILLDCYGLLLTQRQRSLLSQSVNEDCSLSEIAEREGISRQGVRAAVARAAEQLEEYEAKLGIMKRRAELLAGLEQLKNTASDKSVVNQIDRLMEICEDGV